MVPFRLDRSGLITIAAEALGPFEGAEPVAIDAILDTGDSGLLHLPWREACEVRPWLERGPANVHLSPVGSVRSYRGAIAEFRIGPLTMRPAPISMSTEDRPGHAIIGLEWLRHFRGVILDWRHGELLLLDDAYDEAELVRRFPAEMHPWTEVPLIAWNTRVDRSPFGAADGAEQPRRAERINFDVIGFEIEIDGQRLLAILDTGGSGDMLALRPMPVVTGSEQSRMTSSLDDDAMREVIEARLAAPVIIGEAVFDDVPVYRLTRDESEAPPDGFPDVAIGSGLLRRCTIWIDFKSQFVRFGPVHPRANSHPK